MNKISENIRNPTGKVMAYKSSFYSLCNHWKVYREKLLKLVEHSFSSTHATILHLYASIVSQGSKQTTSSGAP